MELTPDGGPTQAQWLVCGSSLGAGNDRVLHFGGVGTGQFQLDVLWPSGVQQTIQGTDADRLVVTHEP